MNNKYELTDKTRYVHGATLYRIRALRDIPRFGVKAGDLGGWIEKEENLSHCGNAWVFGDASVSGSARVFGSARVSGSAWVFGDAWVFGSASVSGNAWVFGSARVCGDAEVCGNASVSGSARVSGSASVFGDAEVCGNASVSGNASVFGDAEVCGNAEVFGNAWVSGSARVCGDAEVCGNADYMTFKNSWSSGRWFTYTRSNKKWTVGCFHGSGNELVKKAYADSEVSGKCYEAIVRATEVIEAAKAEAERRNR